MRSHFQFVTTIICRNGGSRSGTVGLRRVRWRMLEEEIWPS